MPKAGPPRPAPPPLSNPLMVMDEDAALAANITVEEMFRATQRVASYTYQFLPVYCELAVNYLMFCTVLTWVQKQGEKYLNAHGFN